MRDLNREHAPRDRARATTFEFDDAHAAQWQMLVHSQIPVRPPVHISVWPLT